MASPYIRRTDGGFLGLIKVDGDPSAWECTHEHPDADEAHACAEALAAAYEENEPLLVTDGTRVFPRTPQGLDGARLHRRTRDKKEHRMPADSSQIDHIEQDVADAQPVLPAVVPARPAVAPDTTEEAAEAWTQRAADLWSVILGVQVKPHEVALCLAQAEIAIIVGNPTAEGLWDAAAAHLDTGRSLEAVDVRA